MLRIQAVPYHAAVYNKNLSKKVFEILLIVLIFTTTSVRYAPCGTYTYVPIRSQHVNQCRLCSFIAELPSSRINSEAIHVNVLKQF